MAHASFDQFIEDLVADYFDAMEEAWDWASQQGQGSRTRTPARLGPYRWTGGHHIHQSASYGGRSNPRRTNPHHRAALAIAHGPGFTRAQHRRADSVQRRMNRAALGKGFRPDPDSPVRVITRGTGQMPPTPNPWFEDLKAYYGLRAARPAGYETPPAALELVERSARQLKRRGARPRRIPRHGG